MHDLFKRRRSIRQFLPADVTEEKVREILTTAMVGPSGMHKNPWEFVVVRDREKITKLGEAGPQQSFVKNAPVVIVIAVREADSKLWLEDCSIAAAHIYLEATNQGLATCWANVKDGRTAEDGDREQFVRDVLGIPAEYRVVCMMPIGYPAEPPFEHSESEYMPEKVHNDKW